MKPNELSKKSNPWGEGMNLPEAFNQLRNKKHNDSFENLGEWLDHNTQKPKKMKTMYKIAASFTILTLIFVACSIPVEQEEEIGYMIKGKTAQLGNSFKLNFDQELTSVGLDPSLVSIQPVIHELIGEEPQIYNEVVMLLPEANHKSALDKKAALSGAIEFQSLEILPIEEKVKRTLFETAMHELRFDLHEDIDEVAVEERINEFIKLHTESLHGHAKVTKREDGTVVAEIAMKGNSEDNLNIMFRPNKGEDFKAVQNTEGDKVWEFKVEEKQEE